MNVGHATIRLPSLWPNRRAGRPYVLLKTSPLTEQEVSNGVAAAGGQVS
jgi:hypothetical protein